MTVSNKIRLVVDISGGLINAVYTNHPSSDVEILFIDDQIDGADEDDLIEIAGEEHYASMQSPMVNKDHVYAVFAANNPDGFEFGVNVFPALEDGTTNPFGKNFRTADDAESAGQQYLKDHPETQSFTVFVLELKDGQVVLDDSLYTIDREGVQ